MSGGSYNYLYRRDIDQLVNSQHDLDSMVKRLIKLGYDDVAQEADDLLLLIKVFSNRANTRFQRLSGIFKAVEWVDSGDSGMDYIKEEVKKYRGE